LEELFCDAESSDSPQATAVFLHALLNSEVQDTFYKINVHAAMTPSEVEHQLKPAFSKAKVLKEKHDQQRVEANTSSGNTSPLNESFEANSNEGSTPLVSASAITTEAPVSTTTYNMHEEVPFVTVFLDEVNTSSCLGLFKEIIVDRNFDGEPIPENVFIVAACNPHRGNSLVSLKQNDKSWMRSTYYVRSLHPTLTFLKWDYGSLDENQEQNYIRAKMKMVNKNKPNLEISGLTKPIVESQKKMREFARRQLTKPLEKRDIPPQLVEEIRLSARSCVSQRDIQRVFTFYEWFVTMYKMKKPHGITTDYDHRAVMVSLFLVYYMRLDAEFRKEYCEFLDKLYKSPQKVSFSAAIKKELNYYIGQVELPKGIARTLALKENLFATIICAVTHTPLIIVGAPGSSKTLSFN
jgi:hypothetical protein